jgi:predicted dehydrogenase
MNTQLRLAVVGLGNMGSAHALSIHSGQVPGGVLVAVCDTAPSRRQWAEKALPGVAIFDNYDDLLAAEMTDSVVIATPHYFHPPMAIAAFARGLHVLSEKPGGVQVSAVQAMCAAAKASGKTFGIMFNQRTHPLFRRAREIVRGGELGALKRVQWTVTNWYRTQEYYNSGGWRASWAGEGGGVLINQAPHQLDLLQWICGMPATVWADCAVGKYHHVEVEDEATIFAKYENGATATFITTTGEYPGTNRLEIAGERGKLVLEDNKLRWWKLPISEREFCFSGQVPQTEYTEILPTEQETAHNGILRNFTDAILLGEPLLAPGYDAIYELTLSNAAYLSAWTGETVSLPLDTARFDTLLAQKAATSSYQPEKVTEEADGVYKDRWNVNW